MSHLWRLCTAIWVTFTNSRPIFEWAIQAHKNAIDLNIKIGQEDSSGKHYANLGSVYGRQGHYDLALEMMQKRVRPIEIKGCCT